MIVYSNLIFRKCYFAQNPDNLLKDEHEGRIFVTARFAENYLLLIFDTNGSLSSSGKFSDTSNLKLTILNRVANPDGKKIITSKDIR